MLVILSGTQKARLKKLQCHVLTTHLRSVPNLPEVEPYNRHEIHQLRVKIATSI